MAGSAPRVSVVIPNYDHARFLDERVRSVLGQSYTDIEVLLLDDASTDDSVRVLDGFRGDPRVQAIYNDENSGSAFQQWNRGVAHASGEYVWIAESDDLAEPEFLDVLVDRLDRHPEVGLVSTDSWLVDEAGGRIGSYFERQQVRAWVDADRWRRDFVVRGREECRDRLILLNTIPSASAVLFRRSVYLEAGGADERYTMVGDWVLWMRMLLVSDLAYVARRLSSWRQHPASIQRRAARSGLDVEEVFRATAELLPRLDPAPAALERLRSKLASFWYWRWRRLFPRIPLARTLRICRSARAIDPRWLRRLVDARRGPVVGWRPA